MDILIKILQFVASFSLLVLVHEFGHYIMARIFKVRVDRFMLFFGRPIVKFKHKDTIYGIGWLPFGGYCKLAGMVDESMDTDQLKGAPQKWEFRAQKAWKRLLIMIGGVLMNVVLAFAIYVGMTAAWGDAYVSTRDMKWGYAYSPVIQSEFGLQNGDKILSVDGKEIENFSDLAMALILEQGRTMEVERGTERFSMTIPVTSLEEISKNADFIVPRFPFVIGAVGVDTGASEAGIEVGDSLVSLDGVSLEFYDQYVSYLSEKGNDTVMLGVVREGELVELPLVLTDGKMGVNPDGGRFFPVHRKDYTLLQSIPAGVKRVGTEISSYWKQLKMMTQPKTEAYKSMSGPLGIGNIFPPVWDWYIFWRITALLSIALAIMNLLPIPALDGGHTFILLIEMITGRRASERTLINLQVVGMFIMVALMIMVTWNDIQRLFF